MSESAKRNPTWSKDELIVALDFYIRFNGNPPDKRGMEIKQLSDILNQMDCGKERATDKFRNANGVYMKLMNFRRFDPKYAAKGRSGLTRGGKGEEEVWNDFYYRPKELKEAAGAIKLNLKTHLPEVNLEEEEVAEAAEGRLLTRIHLARERSREIVQKKKARVLKETGKLVCEACEFDFEKVYGERGKGFAEAHHIKPLHTIAPGTRTKLDDLVVLCANCHRMVHSKKPWLDLEDLKRIIRR